MSRWLKWAHTLCQAEDAATLVEYTLVMILVAASCFAAVASFGTRIDGLFLKAIEAFPH